MELRGPKYCQVGQTVEYRLSYEKKFNTLNVRVMNPRGVAAEPSIMKSGEPKLRKICFVASEIGFYTMNVFKNKTNDLIHSENCFAIGLENEKWHVDRLYWSLETILLTMDMQMHMPIINNIAANAHLLSIINNSINPKVLIRCEINILPDKSCKFSFTPPQYGSYDIRFLCGDFTIPDPQPRVHVINIRKLKLIHSFTLDNCLTSVGQNVPFIFELCGAPSEFLKAWIKYPDDTTLDMLLYGEEKNNKIGQLRCDFKPSTIGVHFLYAYYDEVLFDKCPFEFNTFDPTVVEVVHIEPNIDSGTNLRVGETLTITYNCARAGQGQLDVSTTVCDHTEMYSTIPVNKSEMDDKGMVVCSIILSIAGQYLIEGFFNKEKVNSIEAEVWYPLHANGVDPKTPLDQVDSKLLNGEFQYLGDPEEDPITPLVEEKSPFSFLSSIKENILINSGLVPIVTGDGLIEAEVGKVAEFLVNPQRKNGKLTVDVTGPQSLAKCLIKPESTPGQYNVEYYPNEIGLYQITLLWNNQPLRGSPFKVEATDPKSIQCVSHANIFTDTVRLCSGRKAKIDFSYSLAGKGRMSARVKQKHFQSNVKTWTTVTKKIWTFWVEPADVGSFDIDVFWNNKILGVINFISEFQENLPPELLDDPASQILLKGRGLKGAWVGEAGEFVVDTFNVGDGELQLDLKGSKATLSSVPVHIEAKPNGTYECKYEASVPGDYLLSIAWGNKVVTGSPFPLTIWSKDPSRAVVCRGDGLKHGVVGEDSLVEIDASEVFGNPVECSKYAKSRMISVFFKGPDKKTIKCDLIKKSDKEYNVNLNAKVPGRHQLNVMYRDKHVPGSPFFPYFTDKESLEKLKVYGPGLKSGSLREFQSYFTVDTSEAGVGKLRVQVKGPKEAFRVEVQKDPQDNRLIKCSYSPSESGEYTISMNWSGCPIKGSPFKIILQ